MDFRKLAKDILTGNTRDLRARATLLVRKLKRVSHELTHKKLSDDELRNIPVIINNRNRYTYLLMLVEWLERNGMRNIVILDNDSAYPPLLDYYRSTKHRVILLKKNGGPRSVWESEQTAPLLKGFYIYSDPDVVPQSGCDFSTIKLMHERLCGDYGIDKIGLALRIDDLPAHFKLRDEVIKWEKQFWEKQESDLFFRAPVDTTFALYAPFAQGGGECKALRTNVPHVAAHMPWYENSASPTAEDEYYRSHSVAANSHWTQLTAQS